MFWNPTYQPLRKKSCHTPLGRDPGTAVTAQEQPPESVLQALTQQRRMHKHLGVGRRGSSPSHLLCTLGRAFTSLSLIYRVTNTSFLR